MATGKLSNVVFLRVSHFERCKKYIRRSMRPLAVALPVGGMSICAYYGWVIHDAGHYTINTILPEEKAAQYPLQLTALTQRQLDILLAVEDPRFFEHKGIDFSSPGAGITTITQGLVKHLYFTKFRPGVAKLKQTLIAFFVLVPLMTKQMQLRRFINTVYFGPKAIGFEQAADFYYRKRFEQLTEEQYISIVAMIVAPNPFNIATHPERNEVRVQRIQKASSMFITES